MHELSSITDRRARPGGTCLSADPLTVDVQLGLMVTGSCVCVFLFARSCISIDFYIFLSPSGAAVAGVYRVAGKGMAPLEALVLGVGQTTLSVVISFSRILATL